MSKKLSESGKIREGGKVRESDIATTKTTSFFKLRSQLTQQANIDVGLAAEKRVQHKLGNDAVFLSSKETFDSGKPDLRYKNRLVEVKSFREYVKEGEDRYAHGRVQFLRSELENLANQNGFIIIELRYSDKQGRETGKRDYFQASAQEILALVADEQGEELKVEYSQVLELKPFIHKIEV